MSHCHISNEFLITNNEEKNINQNLKKVKKQKLTGAMGDFLRLALKMERRDPSSGSGMYINWSKRPKITI